jgi:hypothetical protein
MHVSKILDLYTTNRTLDDAQIRFFSYLLLFFIDVLRQTVQ